MRPPTNPTCIPTASPSLPLPPIDRHLNHQLPLLRSHWSNSNANNEFIFDYLRHTRYTRYTRYTCNAYHVTRVTRVTCNMRVGRELRTREMAARVTSVGRELCTRDWRAILMIAPHSTSNHPNLGACVTHFAFAPSVACAASAAETFLSAKFFANPKNQLVDSAIANHHHS